MIQSKKDLEFYLREDRNRNLHCEHMNPLKFYFRLWAKVDGCMAYHYLKALRKYEYAINCHKNGPIGNMIVLLRKVYLRRLSAKYNIIISPNTVGYGLYLPHIIGGGIVVICESMGNNCVINTNVLIGKKDFEDEKPIIGDNIEINSGAVIFGKIKIGNNAKIAPNTVVFKDVPEYGLVSGVPAQLIKIANNQY